MGITSIEEYGLRCILQFARNRHKKSMSTSEIAREEGLGIPYVAQLMDCLLQSGLIESVLGLNSGYKLSRHPSDISVYEVFSAITKAVLWNKDCVRYCRTSDRYMDDKHCALYVLWDALDGIVKDYLRGISLEDLLNGDVFMEGYTRGMDITNIKSIARFNQLQRPSLRLMVTREDVE